MASIVRCMDDLMASMLCGKIDILASMIKEWVTL